MATRDNPAAIAGAADDTAKAATMGHPGALVPAVIAICVGCALSIGAYFTTARMEDREQQIKLEREADVWFDQIEKRIDHTISVLRSIAGLYAASGEVERVEFRAFVRALGEQQAVQALEWIPRVPRARRAAFEETARENGFPDFAFTERQSQGNMVRAGTRAEYFPVYFVQPYAGNKAALGFDLGSNPARLEALNRARDSGEMIATSRITLVQETSDQYGFLVFIPIYRNGAPKDTVAERRVNLMGFGVGVFRIGDLVNATIAESSSSRNSAVIQIFDQSAPEENRRLYPKTLASGGEAELLPHHRNTRTLSVAGRNWLLVATPTAKFIKEISQAWRPWAMLLAGLFFTALVALYLKLIASRTREVEFLVEERTIKLTRANEELEQTGVELAKLADDLKTARDEAETANQIKSEILAAMRERTVELEREITDRKRAQESLQLAEFALDHASDATLWLDRDGRVAFANNASCRMLGYSHDELLGSSVTDFDPDASLDSFALAFERIKAHGPSRFEAHHRTKGGEYIPVEVSIHHIRFGNAELMCSYSRDITERKRAEQKLRESEERYRELFDDSPVAIWEEDWSPVKQMLDDLAPGGVKDWRGYFNSHRDQLRTAYDLAKITEISRATVDIYRAASKEELVRWSAAAFVIDEELDAFREIVLSFLAGQMTVEIESKDTAAGKSKIMVRRRVVMPPKYCDDWSRVIYAIEDITERKRAEEELRRSEARLAAIMENAPAEIYLKDVEGRYVVINRECEKLWGVTREDVQGKLPEQVEHPGDLAQLVRAHDLSVLESGEVIEQEHEVLIDDNLHTINFVKFPIRDAAGEI